MTWSGRRSFAGIVVCAALGVASPAAASGGGGTPLPRVTGPLPVTATSYPFGAADHTLVPEDLQEGRLRRGRVPRQRQGQRLHVARARSGRGAHAERAVHDAHPRAPAGEGLALQRQRRGGDAQPVQPVRPQHRLGDGSPPDGAQRRRLGGHHRQADRRRGAEEVRSGPLRLAVVRQPAGARRSAQLPDPVDSVDSTTARAPPRTGWPGTSTARSARCVRSRDRDEPAGLHGNRHGWRARARRARACKHVYGFGYSQTGGYLYDYINAIHPLDVARNGGHPIYDGYIVAVAGGGLRGLRADQPVRAAADRRRPARCSSPTSACRSSTSCRSRTTCSASTPAGPTATRPRTATATTRWPAPATRRPTS